VAPAAVVLAAVALVAAVVRLAAVGLAAVVRLAAVGLAAVVGRHNEAKPICGPDETRKR
jgi:hypothetical protein